MAGREEEREEERRMVGWEGEPLTQCGKTAGGCCGTFCQSIF